MPNRDLWNKNVPRVEYDHGARDTRLRLEYLERVLVKRDAVRSFRYFGWILLLLNDIAGNGRERGRRTRPSNDWRPYYLIPGRIFIDIASLIARLRAPPARA